MRSCLKTGTAPEAYSHAKKSAPGNFPQKEKWNNWSARLFHFFLLLLFIFAFTRSSAPSVITKFTFFQQDIPFLLFWSLIMLFIFVLLYFFIGTSNSFHTYRFLGVEGTEGSRRSFCGVVACRAWHEAGHQGRERRKWKRWPKKWLDEGQWLQCE